MYFLNSADTSAGYEVKLIKQLEINQRSLIFGETFKVFTDFLATIEEMIKLKSRWK